MNPKAVRYAMSLSLTAPVEELFAAFWLFLLPLVDINPFTCYVD